MVMCWPFYLIVYWPLRLRAPVWQVHRPGDLGFVRGVDEIGGGGGGGVQQKRQCRVVGVVISFHSLLNLHLVLLFLTISTTGMYDCVLTISVKGTHAIC